MDLASKEKALEKQTTRHDAIRVENIRKERHYAKEWLKRWGFLTQGEQREDALQAFCKGRSYEETKRQLSKIMKDGVMYDAEKCFHDPNQWYRDVKDIGPQNKYLHPATASQEVGWRTNESLEKFGVNHYGYKKKTADIQPARLKNAQPNASGL